MLREIVEEARSLSEKETYKEYFAGMLKKWKVKSPGELDKADKKKFFSEVSAGWESEEEKGD